MDFEITKVPDQEAVSPPEESAVGTIGRTLARSTARAAESVLGLPGEITEGISSLVGAGEKAIFGEKKTPQKIDLSSGLLKKINSTIKSFTGYDSPLPDQLSLPNSEDIKEYITKPIGKLLPEGTLEPKTDWEKLSDEIISDGIPLLIPIKGKIPFARALKISGLSNLSSWLSKKLGFSEKGQAAAKLGTTLLTTFASPGIVNKYAKTLKPTQAANFLDEVKRSSVILNTLERYTNKAVNPITGILLGAHYGKGVLSAIGIGGAYGAGVLEKTLKTFSKNPKLMSYYGNILASAAKQNAPLILKNIKKFDSEISKEIPIKEISLPIDKAGDFEITKLS